MNQRLPIVAMVSLGSHIVKALTKANSSPLCPSILSICLFQYVIIKLFECFGPFQTTVGTLFGFK